MQRHELIHRNEQESAKPKGARACTECAVAKVRCSGGQPCSRCESRDSDCRYPESRPRSDDAVSLSDSSPNDQLIERKGNGHNTTDPFRAPPPPRSSNMALAVSPTTWDQGAPSPSSWFPRSASLDFATSTPDFAREVPEPPRQAPSFSTQPVQPPGVTSFTDSCTSLKQAGFVTAAMSTPGVSTSSTRHWLETIVEPQPIPESDAGTPRTAVSQKTSGSGEFYVEGHGARLAKIGVHRRYSARASLPLPSADLLSQHRTQTRNYGFPASVAYSNLQMTSSTRRILLSDVVYNEIRRQYNILCTQDTPFFTPYESLNFPSWDNMQDFIYMYLDEFQPLIPMLHLPTLNLSSSPWILSLALSSAGSQFAESAESEQTTLAMHEFLRRAIITTVRPLSFPWEPYTDVTCSLTLRRSKWTR